MHKERNIKYLKKSFHSAEGCCYTRKNSKNVDVEKYHLFLFLSFFIAQNVRLSRERVSQWSLKCTYIHTYIQTYIHTRGQWCSFSVKHLCLSASFSRVEIFPGLYNLPYVHTIHVVTPSTYALRRDTPPV